MVYSDSETFLEIAKRISERGDVSTLLEQANFTNHYTSKTNVLKLILAFTYPNTILAERIVNWVEITQGKTEEDVTASSDDDNYIDTAADDLLKSIKEFEVTDLKSFVVAKTLHWSKYTNDLSLILPLFNLADLNFWYNGIISPFIYYSDHGTTDLNFYLNCTEYNDLFNILIEPLVKSSNLHIINYMNHVILPLIKYHNYNIDPLLAFLFSPHPGKPYEKYLLWKEVIHSFALSDFEYGNYQEVIKCFIASVYYYSERESTSGSPSLYRRDSASLFSTLNERSHQHSYISPISSVEITRIYDLIKSTLKLFDFNESSELNVSSLPSFLTFEEFITDENNQLKPYFEPTAENISLLHNITTVCQKLFSTNKLTIYQYLTLKQGSIDKEIIKCCANLSKGNWLVYTIAIELIISEFGKGDQERVNELVIERFLFANLFDVVKDFQEKGKFLLNSEKYFNLVLTKFWDSYNSSQNLNDKIGSLKDATDCLALFETLNLLEEQRNEIVKIKHLLKAVHNLKNYRIVLNKSQLVPSQILNFEENPLNLIMSILDQNTKSYLAFDKLYKILNDLSIFFGSDKEYFNRLKTACIESSLIDGNFAHSYKQASELLKHYNSTDLNDNWLTFYQVGKYREEYMDLATLNRKSEILAKTLLIMNSSNENSQTVLQEWKRVQSEIDEAQTRKVIEISSKPEIVTSRRDIIHNVAATGTQASEKLTNMFATGLGWAIGANKN